MPILVACRLEAILVSDHSVLVCNENLAAVVDDTCRHCVDLSVAFTITKTGVISRVEAVRVAALPTLAAAIHTALFLWCYLVQHFLLRILDPLLELLDLIRGPQERFSQLYGPVHHLRHFRGGPPRRKLIIIGAANYHAF